MRGGDGVQSTYPVSGTRRESSTWWPGCDDSVLYHMASPENELRKILIFDQLKAWPEAPRIMLDAFPLVGCPQILSPWPRGLLASDRNLPRAMHLLALKPSNPECFLREPRSCVRTPWASGV